MLCVDVISFEIIRMALFLAQAENEHVSNIGVYAVEMNTEQCTVLYTNSNTLNIFLFCSQSEIRELPTILWATAKFSKYYPWN